ncbi:MAG: ABC transporter ATP-binding protein [Geminicoccaceae bacterium]|nr:ABC transporter ATP-binding protein [Geminicoccaceae bacterium]
MATLTLDRVSKIYGHGGKDALKAVNDVNMAIDDGEIIGLLGSSGCGKTSTLRMIAGFEGVTEGDVKIGDRVVNRLSPAQRNVAMAFEGYALYPPLTIRDNIAFGFSRDRLKKAEVDARVKRIADLLEINDILERYPPTISGGQQQRASLARALVRNADLYLLDEPMGQLEPRLRAILRARIKEWIIERRLTTIIVTHDQTEALALCDRIAVMEAGVLLQLATPHELKDRPANLFVASFIGEPPMNVFKARVERDGGVARLIAGDEAGHDAFGIELPLSGAGHALGNRHEVHLGIRPHLVAIGGGGALRGQVVSNQWLGDQSHIGIDLGGATLIAVTDGALDVPAGSEAPLTLPLESIHLFDAESGVALMHGLEPAAPGVRAAA